MNKDEYIEFCKKVYVPIYSKSWWLDAVCGAENWDVWLYKSGGDILAAMPYYMEKRGNYTYITKALLTQNNGIIFFHTQDAKLSTKQSFEEKVINAACDFIRSLGVDVYEQQYQYSFTNWLPFYWNYYTAITRYTYVLEDLSNLELVWENISGKYRKNIKKGQRNATFHTGLDEKIFFTEHEKVFLRQGLQSPFTQEQWGRIYGACKENNAGEIFYATDKEGHIASVLFLIWDEQSAYHLLGGNVPEHHELETYNALTWEAIKYAAERELKYDFEGSVIKRITKSYREYGGIPKAYFRIRKVFNPEIIRAEMQKQVEELNQEGK